MKYRDFKVTAVLNGFIIEIGCQKEVASSSEELIKLIILCRYSGSKNEKRDKITL